MNWTRPIQALVLVATVASMTSTTGYAQEHRPKAHVEVRLLSTARAGATGSASASTGRTLAVGQTGTIGVAGDFSGGSGTGGWPIGGTGDVAWRVDARIVAVEIDTVEVAIKWGRYRPGVGHEEREVGDDRVVRLMTGQRHVLDLVHASASSSPLANLVVEIEARQVEDPAYVGAPIGYDIWFVHESRTGQKTTRRAQIVGSQADWKAFEFRPLGFSLDGAPLPAEASAPVGAYLEGELLGRLRPDGSVGLAIRNRFGIECATGGTNGRSGGRGEKELVAGDGETVSLELPVSIGWCTVSAPSSTPSNARRGVTAVKGGLRVTASEFFSGERFSLLVTARRQQ